MIVIDNNNLNNLSKIHKLCLYFTDFKIRATSAVVAVDNKK